MEEPRRFKNKKLMKENIEAIDGRRVGKKGRMVSRRSLVEK